VDVFWDTVHTTLCPEARLLDFLRKRKLVYVKYVGIPSQKSCTSTSAELQSYLLWRHSIMAVLREMMEPALAKVHGT